MSPRRISKLYREHQSEIKLRVNSLSREHGFRSTTAFLAAVPGIDGIPEDRFFATTSVWAAAEEVAQELRAKFVAKRDMLCPECQNQGHFDCGVPGIKAHVRGGRIMGQVLRCERCQRFSSDWQARRLFDRMLRRLGYPSFLKPERRWRDLVAA